MGVIAAPPKPLPVETSDMARLFLRRNYWLTAGKVALL